MARQVKKMARWVGLLASLALAGCALRPMAMDAAQNANFVARLQSDLNADSLPASRPLDLYDALARALLTNQDLKAAQMARLLGDAELSLATAEMLPQFVASSQVYARNNVAASTSHALTTPNRLNGYSVSSEQISRSRELALSWNILDFGVSYFRARQAAHRSNIAAEQQRRIANQIAEETRLVFWRALALQRLDDGLSRLDAEMNATIANAGKLTASGLTDPMDALAAERDLLGIRRELDQQRKLLVGADEQLRALINYPPTAPLRLAETRQADVPPLGRITFGDLATIALSNRPEIRQAAYEQQITAEEARIAFLELFPNLNLVLGATMDQNPFLLHQGWTSAAARASWQLVKILQYPARSGLLDGRSDLDRQKAKALAVAVILQGQVSLSRLQHVQNEHRTLTKLAAVQQRLAVQVQHLYGVGRAGAQAVTKERMNALLAEARRQAAYGEVQAAYAAMLTAFGHDLADTTTLGGQSVDELAQRLRQTEATAFSSPPRLAGSAAQTASLRTEMRQ